MSFLFKNSIARLVLFTFVGTTMFLVGFFVLLQKIHEEDKEIRSEYVSKSLLEVVDIYRINLLKNLQQNQLNAIFSLSQQTAQQLDNFEKNQLSWTYKDTRYCFFSTTDVEEIRAVTGGVYSANVVPATKSSSYVLRFPVESTTGKFYMVFTSFHPPGYILSELNLEEYQRTMSWQGAEKISVKSYLLTDQNKIVLTNDTDFLGEDFSHMLVAQNSLFDATIFAENSGESRVKVQKNMEGSVSGIAWQRIHIGEREFSLVVLGKDAVSGFRVTENRKSSVIFLAAFLFVFVPLIVFLWVRRKKDKQFFGDMLDVVPHAMLCIDGSRKIVACNEMMETSFGFDRSEVVGLSVETCRRVLPLSISQILDTVDLPNHEKAVRLAECDGIQCENDGSIAYCSVAMASGEKIFALTSKVVSEVDAALVGYAVTIEDVTAYRSVLAALEKKTTQYDRVVEAGSHGIWQLDKETGEVFLSPRAKMLLGYGPDEMESSLEAWWNLIHPDDYTGMIEEMRTLSLESPSFEIEYRVLHRDGRYRWMLSRGVGVWQNGELTQIVGSHADITRRKKQELTFEVLYKVSTASYLNRGLGRYLESVHEAVVAYTQVENFFVALWRKETGAFDFVYYRDEKEGDQGAKHNLEQQEIHEIPGLSGCVMRQGKSLLLQRGDPELLKSSVGAVPESWLGVPLILNRQPIGLIAVQDYENANAFVESDIRLLEAVGEQVCRAIERHQVHEHLYHQATHDSLTELLNREHFLDWGARVLSKQKRDGRKHALLMLDLNRFKQINDSLGHQVGDLVLIEASKIIRSQLRDVDTLARLGGDEFAVLLENSGPPVDVIAVVKRIINAFTLGVEIGGRKIVIGTSVGIVIDIERYDTIADVMRDADIAMYEAKNKSSLHFRIFNQKLHARVKKNIEIEQILTNEFHASEFVVYYQPIVDLSERRLSGFEALVRWRSPKLGYLRPDQFIPIAEETGTIAQIDACVLDQACQDLVRWRGHISKAIGLTVSVNLSQSELIDVFLSKKIIECTKRNGLDPSLLFIELTESALMRNLQLAKRMLGELKRDGVGVSIDDFGTGYSSLAHLADLPFHTLKIDRSFLSGLAESKQRMTVLKTLVDMSKSLAMPAVAEGIETLETLELITQLGCRYGQGYYFSKPMSQDLVVPYIENFSFDQYLQDNKTS